MSTPTSADSPESLAERDFEAFATKHALRLAAAIEEAIATGEWLGRTFTDDATYIRYHRRIEETAAAKFNALVASK